jgi:hypothetical protein
MKESDLARRCDFTKVCAESDYGSYEICRGDYESCKAYKRRQEKLREEARQWCWWLIPKCRGENQN